MKFMYEGIPYLNKDQESELRQQLHIQPSLITNDVDNKLLRMYSSIISEWVQNANENEELIVQGSEALQAFYSSLKIEAILRRQMRDIWTSTNDLGQIVVKKVSNIVRKELEKSEGFLEERILDKLLGFSKVIGTLIETKKPIIGHNMLLDLLFIYQQFYRELPDSYTEFKKELNLILPTVFDTKFIANELRKKLKDCPFFNDTCLEDLYFSLDSKKPGENTGCQSYLRVKNTTKEVNKKPATHRRRIKKSYSTDKPNYIWAKAVLLNQMRPGVVIKKKRIKGLREIQPQGFVAYLHTFKQFKNCINLSRATIHCLNLNGPDPRSVRPEWLYIELKDSNILACNTQLANVFGAYGSVDVKLLDKKHAILAVATHRGSKDILKAFHKHKSFRVVKYNVLKHSPRVRLVLWSGVAMTAVVCIWTIFSSQRQ
uniref:Poly(A)-specific ribonuclease PARN-like domain-containing protein 1-like n=1 Tax=Saccoglossus kowalevskii TaxID=10224 RepID=A0ABM0MJ11_SACKO|nr:PREDICTED: poly(A)-specific ribonuclease PARN-like domain-containing protein 1-like [Saccoglossus kowalevskii]